MTNPCLHWCRDLIVVNQYDCNTYHHVSSASPRLTAQKTSRQVFLQLTTMEVDLFKDKENSASSSHPLPSKAAIFRSKHRPAVPTSLPEQSSTRLGLLKASSTSSQTEQDCTNPILSSQIKPARPLLQPLKLSSNNTSFASLPPCQFPQDCEVEEQPIPASMFQFPPTLAHQPYPTPHQHRAAQPAYPQQQHPFAKEAPVTCVVEQEGHLRLHLRFVRFSLHHHRSILSSFPRLKFRKSHLFQQVRGHVGHIS